MWLDKHCNFFWLRWEILGCPTPYGDPNKIALLFKTLYELKQSACQWVSLLGVALKEAGLKPLYSDSSVYVCNPEITKMIIIVIYVDDILFTGPNMDEINALKRWLSDRF